MADQMAIVSATEVLLKLGSFENFPIIDTSFLIDDILTNN